MARVRTDKTKPAKPGTAKSRAGEAKAKREAGKRTPAEALDLPGVEQEADATLEKYGRELAGIDASKKATARMEKAAKDRISKRLAELGLHIYRLKSGELLTATDSTKIKIEAKAPKKKSKGKRRTEAEGPR